MVEKEKYGVYNGIISLAIAVSFILGPIRGGAITDGTTWRWIFWINLPVRWVRGAATRPGCYACGISSPFYNGIIKSLWFDQAGDYTSWEDRLPRILPASCRVCSTDRGHRRGGNFICLELQLGDCAFGHCRGSSRCLCCLGVEYGSPKLPTITGISLGLFQEAIIDGHVPVSSMDPLIQGSILKCLHLPTEMHSFLESH